MGGKEKTSMRQRNDGMGYEEGPYTSMLIVK